MFEEYSDLVTFNEFCVMIKRGRNKAYQLLKDREIIGFKCGHNYLIPKEHIIAYIKRMSA